MLETDVPVAIVACMITDIKYAASARNPDRDSFLEVEYILTGFNWKNPVCGDESTKNYDCGMISNIGDFRSNDRKDEDWIVNTFPINGHAWMRACNKCGEPVCVAITINGITHQFVSDTEPVDGLCESGGH